VRPRVRRRRQEAVHSIRSRDRFRFRAPVALEGRRDALIGGYRTGVTEKQLEGAPKYGNDNDWNQTRNRAVNDYCGVVPNLAAEPAKRRASCNKKRGSVWSSGSVGAQSNAKV